MDEQERRKLIDTAVRGGSRKLVEDLAKAGAERVGRQVAQKVVTETYVSALKQGLTSGAQNVGFRATAAAAAKGAGTMATVKTVAPAVGKAAGVAAAPLVEMGLLLFDDDEHEPVDYAKAAGRGAAAGTAGVLATAATAAAVGSVVPVVGTAAGFVAGLVASTVVSSKLKEFFG